MHAQGIKGHPGGMERRRAGGNQDDIGRQVTRPTLLEGHAHRVRVRQTGRTPDGIDVVVLQITDDDGPFRLHDGLLSKHYLADVEVLVE